MYSFIKRTLQGAALALAFSSRLPVPQVSGLNVGAALAWLPSSGVILSLLALIPFISGLITDIWIAAWLYLAVYIWLNRALHWDGLADVADGLGSNKIGAAFWEVVKDSKLGAIGSVAIFLSGLGYVVLAHNLLETGHWLVLPWAAAFSRAFALLMPSLCPHNSRQGLGQMLQEAAPFRAALIWIFLLIIAGWIIFSFPAVFPGPGLGFLVLWALSRNARKHDGFNGDFLGAAITLCELAVMLGTVPVL